MFIAGFSVESQGIVTGRAVWRI